MKNNDNAQQGERIIEMPKLMQWQLDVYNYFNDKPSDITVIKAKRQIGKSILAEILLLKYSLEKNRSISCIVEPTLNQSRRVFKEIITMMNGSNTITSANASLLTIDFVNGSQLLFKSAEQEEGLRGMSISGLLVIDEGAFIQDDIYEILFPTVDAHKAPILILSTPLFKSGYFYNLYTSETTTSFDWSTYDTSVFLSNEKLREYERTLSPLKFRSEYLGLFIDEGGFVFNNIGDCIQKEKPTTTPKYSGIDWAVGEGGDFTVVTFMDDDKNITDITLIKNMTPTNQVERIAEEINARPSLTKVLAEKNSIGAVYMDSLKKKLKKPSILQPFITNNDSKRRIIENLATEFDNRGISIPNINEVIKQLQYYAVEKTKNGYTYNGVNGVNDDVVISLALALEAKKTNISKYTISF